MTDRLPDRPLCFVLMPFGRKQGSTGTTVDFDAVYAQLIEPAIQAADLEPIMADQEVTGGIIHKPMFERLMLCEYAVADLTLANPNVFYELGIRHVVRPWSTVLVFAEGGQLPFDVALTRALPYHLDTSGLPTDIEASAGALTDRLRAAREASTDSPVFQLIEHFPTLDLAHLKTDVFRDRARYSEEAKQKLAAARRKGGKAVKGIEKELGPIGDVEAGVLIDLFLSYRAVKGWTEMVSLVERMPEPLLATPMVQEQLGFALNRLGRREEAEQVLTAVIERHGPSPETFGILGRVYKDMADDAAKAGSDLLARGHLDRAIDAYLKGFEADWRDSYPGINAITLMELRDPPDPRGLKLLPVVAYDVERRLAAGHPDYWDHATLLELSVLARDQQGAKEALTKALAAVREPWEPETTSNNIRLIREARARRDESLEWAAEVEQALTHRAVELAGTPEEEH
jgi:tetratricopeptide (TPR) repeat protein